MKILFVTDQYKPAVNGIVTHLVLLREELLKRGHEVWIVAPYFGKKTEPEEHVLRLPSVVFPPRPVDRFTIPFNRKIEKQLADLHFDVVHNQLFLMGYLGSRLAKKQNLPNLTTLHTPFTQFVRWSFPYLLKYSLPTLNFLMRRYFKNYDLVLCPSARSADELLDAHIKAPVKILHNGIKYEFLPRVYADADVFVFSSKTETQGMSPIEAMTSALPVVAVNDKTLSELIINGKNGYLTARNDKDFAEKILTLLTSEETRQEMGKEARLSTERYSLTEATKELVKIYEGFIVKHKSKKASTFRKTFRGAKRIIALLSEPI